MEATLLQNEDSQPVALTGGGDLEPEGTIKSFNLQGTSSGSYSYFTFDFGFNIVASEAKITTVKHSVALDGPWNETTCNFYVKVKMSNFKRKRSTDKSECTNFMQDVEILYQKAA
ncbi:MAG: hypothetical protein K9N10_00395 [Deltaproteobacteria bacterium]|nr:hypothetical protein [Deltaproteobacteria bacterium]